jgi:hypothetical protein
VSDPDHRDHLHVDSRGDLARSDRELRLARGVCRYDGVKIKTQTGQLSALSFTETCGLTAGNGTPVPIKATLTATDSAGNVATVMSGQGSQPALQLRTFACP